MNKCDGCARRLPLKNGLHRGIGWDVIGCTKNRYIKTEKIEGTVENWESGKLGNDERFAKAVPEPQEVEK